jgi:hypothetical protein
MLITWGGFQNRLSVETIQVGSTVMSITGIQPMNPTSAQTTALSADLQKFHATELAKLRTLLKG